MTRSLDLPIAQLLVLLAVAACMFFVGLGRLPLTEPDEGRNAEVAREMLEFRDWITPRYDTLTYLDKPVVLFWLVAASFRTFGVSEWAARFPSALMALATSLLVWFLAGRMFGARTALRAGLIWVTSPLATVFARSVIFDMPLVFFVTLAMVSYWLSEADGFPHAWRETIFFAAMGLAAITKGPVGFLLPLLSISAFLALRGRLRGLRKLSWGLGIPVFLAAALPWFVAVSVRNPDFPKYALWQESVLRFATGRAHRPGGPFYYLPVFLAGFLPWSFFLLFAGWNRIKGWRGLRQEDHKPHLFLLAWAAVVFVFFSMSRSKLPGYFLPATVPLSILMAKVWAELDGRMSSRRPDWLTAGFASLVFLGLLLAFCPQLLRFHRLQLLATRRIPSPLIPFLQPSLFLGGLILAGLGVLGRNLSARLPARTVSAVSFAILALTTPLLAARWIVPLEAYAASSSSRRLAEAILKSPEKDLPVYGYCYFRTGLPFYLQRPVGLVTWTAGEFKSNYIATRWQARRPSGSQGTKDGILGETPNGYRPAGAANSNPILIDASKLVAFVEASATPWLVLVRGDRVTQLAQTVGSWEPLWDGWDYSVWRVQAQGEKMRIYRLKSARRMTPENAH
jgi:4-amino-4-deoxy-L-arabinose transferase-like glycosyltransferase